MRTAVLALAFDHLGAEYAITSAWKDNKSSLGVSESLGYVDNGFDRHRRDDYADDMKHLRLTRDAWRVRGPYDVGIDCLEPCLTFFGLTQG
jgi:RimJ/RimL family protein N-acetyltransferase